MGFAHPFDVFDLTKTFAGRARAAQGFFDELKVNGFAFFLTVSGATRKNRSDSKPFLGHRICCIADSRGQKKILNFHLTVAKAGDSTGRVQAIMTTFYKSLKTKTK
jgi:hypothetical protein